MESTHKGLASIREGSLKAQDDALYFIQTNFDKYLAQFEEHMGYKYISSHLHLEEETKDQTTQP
jgi:hypothetical protein